MTFFEALWFVVVTFSTVGYGDFTPDIWPSQFYMIVMIGAALVVVPSQVSPVLYQRPLVSCLRSQLSQLGQLTKRPHSPSQLTHL